MLLTLLAIIFLGVVSAFLLVQDNTGSILGFLGAFVVVISLVAYIFYGWDYIASEYKANIINREYKTNYTRYEVFYANDVIDTIQQINRQRIELNGNLINKETK